MTEQTSVKRRRDWQALWSGVWGGASLIIIGYIFWQAWFTQPENERFSQRTLELLISYWPVILVLIGISLIGSGIIRWYEGGARERRQ
jgi:hypothetical protein